MNKKLILFTIGLVIFLDNVGGGLIAPILPTLFMNKQIGFSYISSDFMRVFYYGLSFMLFPLAVMFSSPLLGYLSDLKGRKFIIIFGMIGLALTNVLSILSILSMNLWLFLFTR